MRNTKLVLLFFTAFISFQCVETLITVRVFPDGKYLMQFRSEGDEKDIYDRDFPIPAGGKWASDIVQKGDPESGETVHIISSQAILNGSTTFHDANKGPAPQRHPITVKKWSNFFSTQYSFNQIFKGRGIHNKYPLLAKSMSDTGKEGLNEKVETEIIMYCLQMGLENLQDDHGLDDLLIERILNHFRGVFYKAEEEGNLFGVLNDSTARGNESFVLPAQLIKINFRPFSKDLPAGFPELCMAAMMPFVQEANITVKLHDDSFKFAGILPGVITASNSDSVSNDTLWWTFGSDAFINDDYVIEAASIVYHPKRIQIAIAIGALGILLGLVFISKRRKSS